MNNTIALFHLPNLTQEQQDLIIDLSHASGIGFAVFVESGTTDKYYRLRAITLQQLSDNDFNVWEFPDRPDSEAPFEFTNGEIQASLAQLKTPAFDCIHISEAVFQVMARQLEFQES